MAEEPLRIVAIAGSLRHRSYNQALLRAAAELAPEGMTIEPIEIGALPFFNADVEVEGDPPSVIAFQKLVRAAAAAHERFDADLRLTHEGTRRVLGTLLERFARWTVREQLAATAG